MLATATSPQELAQLRAAEHQRLVASDPNTYGKYAEAWQKRDAAIASTLPSFRSTGTFVDMIPSDDKVKLYHGAQVDIQREQSRMEALQKQQIELAAQQASMQKVVSGQPLDPKNKLDRQSLDTFFGVAAAQTS